MTPLFPTQPKCKPEQGDERERFAQEAAADAFGNRYIASADRDFRDREPTWQRLGDITDKIVQRAAALRVLDDDRNEAA